MIVYMVWCEATEMLYVGKTRSSLAARWSKHLDSAKSGGTTRLCEEIRLLGRDAFEVFTLSRCESEDEMSRLEAWWIEYTSARDTSIGYNSMPGCDEPASVRLKQREADAERKRRWASMSEPDRRAFLSECGKRGAARAKLSRQ